ncbi:MAG: heterodisulfide reductase-related iron-sulfur binding cluster [Candidatus Odinarchaeota archaeon]
MEMLELKMNEQVCLTCSTSDCLVKCQYMDINRDKAHSEILRMIKGEDSFVLHECATCYACEEYCKRGNHPFYLITDLQEKFGILPAPKPLTKQWMNMTLPTRKDIPQFYAAEEPAISLCVFPEYIPAINESNFFNELSIIIGRYFFCQLVYLHLGKPSTTRERLISVIEHVGNHEFKELVCFHDECYSTFTSYASAYGIEVPFKPVHFFEYLYNKLKQYEDKIIPLNVKVAYQRSCSSRLTPETEHFVDDIFELVGATRVSREYVGEKSLCCAGIIRTHQKYDLFVDVQKRNVEDMVAAGAEYCVFNCPMCYASLSEAVQKRNIQPVMMHELCQAAIGEKKLKK